MNWLDANRRNWNSRTPIHLRSRSYDVEAFVRSPRGLQTWEAEHIGSVAGLDVAHLQCHIGLDSIALARDGAQVVGLDLSPAALTAAADIAARVPVAGSVRFVEANVLDASTVLPCAAFDLVYVSIGALCWLPSVAQWAEQVALLLRPGSRLYLHDGHPLAFALDDDQPTVVRSYFEEAQPERFDDPTTYAHDDPTERLDSTECYQWNHSLGEIVCALAAVGLAIERLVEHDWTCWPRFPWLTPTADGRFSAEFLGTRRSVIAPDGSRPRIPLSFTLVAAKRVTGV